MTKAPSCTTFKERFDIAGTIATIIALIVGGVWTYTLFIKGRNEYPHANIEQKLSHVILSDQSKLLRVEIALTNTGNSLGTIGQSIIRIQQILPFPPCPTSGACAAKEVSEAQQKIERQSDRFSWPLIAERTVSFAAPFEIEPGEKQNLDFEFVIPSQINVVRVYTYFRNEQKFKNGRDIGWATSSYYDFRALK